MTICVAPGDIGRECMYIRIFLQKFDFFVDIPQYSLYAASAISPPIYNPLDPPLGTIPMPALASLAKQETEPSLDTCT